MSLMQRCTRCKSEQQPRIEDHAVDGVGVLRVMLPSGWERICGADLCTSCSTALHEFLRPLPAEGDAAILEHLRDRGVIAPKDSQSIPWWAWQALLQDLRVVSTELWVMALSVCAVEALPTRPASESGDAQHVAEVGR